MRLLVLGGTRFLGRAIVDEAIRRGYDVTTFSRGLSGEPRPGAEALHGDRTNSTDLLRVAERDFDLVIDTSVIAPRHVAASARLLAPKVRHYTYVSTLSVYAGFGEVPVSEPPPAWHRGRGQGAGAGGDPGRGTADGRRPGHRARPGRAAAAALGAGPGAAGGRGGALVGAADVGAGDAGVRGRLERHRGP